MVRYAKLRWFLSVLRRASAAHRVAFPLALARATRLYAFSSFSPKELIGYALFVPAVRRTLPVLISKQRSLDKLGAINGPAHHHLTENKDEFHAICRRNALPVPATYGWTRRGVPFDPDGTPIASVADWTARLADRLPERFIVKDRCGAYGSGFRAFRRIADEFASEEDGRRYDATGLARRLSGEEGVDIIVQERLFDHLSLSALCGRRGLQTTRINTRLHDDGRVSVLFFMFKVLASNTLTDNFSMGATGNLIAYGDPNQGILRAAVTLHPCGSGMVRIARHPTTGLAFDGWHLPWWSEAIDLVSRAQACFPQLPALGWDVALTEHGPVIIEANARWDPPNYAPFLMAAEDWRAIFGNGRPGD